MGKTNPNSPHRLRAITVAALKRKPKHIVLIGATKCGKTSLIRRFIHDTFTEDYTPTIEECYSHQYTYAGAIWNLDVIDLCAPFMFPVMRDLNVRKAHIILLVYDIGNDRSLQELIDTTPKIKELRPNGVTTLLVGTKIDTKLDSNASIKYGRTQDLLNQLIDEHKARHILASPKSNIGVTDLFEYCLSDYTKNRPTSLPPDNDDDIPESLDETNEGCQCCKIS